MIGGVTDICPNISGPNHEDIRVAETFAYDPAGRLLTGRQQVGAEAQPVTVASNAYNELGQLVQKALAPNTPWQQQVDYTYNIRGWLTGLNADLVTGATPAATSQDLWGMTLSYDCGFQSPWYNGNISGQQWRGKRDGVARAYGYGYDGANRLLFGDYVAQNATGGWSAEPQRYGLQGVRYDANGNILALQRRGLLANATRAAAKQFGPVDDLAYAYAGNRLRAVNDGVRGNQLPRPAGYRGAPASLAGDFQEQGVRQAQEYAYDANGSLTSDANKGITRILYNHLNLPRQVQFGTGADSVVFRYAANGQKVAKLVYQTGKPMVRTDYLGAYQYEGDSLRFFPHAEGRVLRFVSAVSGQVRYEREYTLKDHLGNLRLAYRAGHRTTCIATLEPDDPTRKREVRQFDSLSVSPPVAQNVGARARTGTYAARLNAGGAAPQPLGPLKQLAVQKGDTVTVTAPGYYPQPVPTGSFAFSLASFVASLVQAQPAPAPGTDGSRRGSLPLLSIGVSAALPALIKPSGGVPQGYVRLLVFDADSNLVGQQVQTRQLSAAAATGYEPLTVQIVAQQDGYVTAYVGNESNADVYFDDVSVTLGQGLQVQENSYDPWGLSLAGLDYASPGIKGLNRYQYNSKERQNDLGLGWSDYGARMYNSQLGLWHVIDPLSEKMRKWSPYSYGFDNPIYNVDIDGFIPWPLLAKWTNSAGETITRHLNRGVSKTPKHEGRDMNMGGGSQDLGAPVRATHNGIVQMANPYDEDKNGAGNRIHIILPDGSFKTVYMHLNSMDVQAGDEVTEGQVIGTVGGTGFGKRNGQLVHLHYEIRKKNAKGVYEPFEPAPDEQMIDPQSWITNEPPKDDTVEQNQRAFQASPGNTSAPMPGQVNEAILQHLIRTVQQWLADHPKSN